MKQLKALIFDVDGRLAETERDGHRIAFNLAFNDAGLDWHWDDALYSQLLVVTGGKEGLAYYLSHFNANFKHDDVDSFIVSLHSNKTQHYGVFLVSNTTALRPGVLRIINQARAAGLRLAIATTTTPENVTALLKSALGEQALTCFDCIAAGDIVPLIKPAPDIFNYCLEKIGLTAEQCLVFEDSANGVRASCAANIMTLVTQNNYTHNDNFEGAVTVLDHMGEPDLACTVLSGQPIAGHYLTIDDLIEIHANG